MQHFRLDLACDFYLVLDLVSDFVLHSLLCAFFLDLVYDFYLD